MLMAALVEHVCSDLLGSQGALAASCVAGTVVARFTFVYFAPLT